MTPDLFGRVVRQVPLHLLLKFGSGPAAPGFDASDLLQV